MPPLSVTGYVVETGMTSWIPILVMTAPRAEPKA
jgi:hypothetical protein